MLSSYTWCYSWYSSLFTLFEKCFFKRQVLIPNLQNPLQTFVLIAPAAQRLPGHQAGQGAVTPQPLSMLDYDRSGNQTLTNVN